MRFAALLPITSRGTTNSELIANVRRLCKRLHSRQHVALHQLTVLIGVDHDDTAVVKSNELATAPSSTTPDVLPSDCYTPLLQTLVNIIRDTDVQVNTYAVNVAPGAVCHIWRQLALLAYNELQCDYTVLLGDDVEILSAQPGEWMEVAHNAFTELHHRAGNQLPFGFGCVAFTDTTFPSFPTFPIIHRTHLLHQPQMFSDKFVNQHADPWLWHLYSRWSMTQYIDVKLVNHCGGPAEARYTKHDLRWSFDLLQDGVAQARRWQRDWIMRQQPDALALLDTEADVYCDVSLDVGVPSYRCDTQYLDRIFALQPPARVQTKFVLIIDHPSHPALTAVVQRYESRGVKVRVNKNNLGAAASRNRLLYESTAKYLLFLDDDVIPAPDILHHYATAIRKQPDACGFVGQVTLPPPTRFIERCMVLSGAAYWFSIAQQFAVIGWGVTANLCVLRVDHTGFDEHSYARTGGGEDVAFCIYLREVCSAPMVTVPTAEVTHPWWTNPLKQIYGWSHSDSALLHTNPHLTYYALPNPIELTLLMLVVSVTTLGRWFNLYILYAPLAADVLHLTTVNYRSSTGEPATSCLPWYGRLAASLAAAGIRKLQDYAHLVGPAKRGWPYPLRYIGRRFDWFTSLNKAAVLHEHQVAAQRFAISVLAVVLMQYFS